VLHHFTDAVRYLEILARATLVACAFRWKFMYQYRWFTCFISAELVRSCLLLVLDRHLPRYAKIWSLTQPVLWVFQIGAVFELLFLIYRQKQFPQRLRRQLFTYYLPFAIAFSAVVTLYEPLDTVKGPWWLLITISITKWLAWICLFLLLAQDVLDVTDTPKLQRELLLHRRLLFLYVGLTPGLMGILVLVQEQGVAEIASFCSEISWLLCLICWVAFWRPSSLRQAGVSGKVL
jgi:hypothetical protein